MKYPSKTLLESNVPRDENLFLFHYTTYSAALGILLSQQMRLGPLVNKNDPLEFENHRDDGRVICNNPSDEDLDIIVNDYVNAVEEKERSVRFASFAMDMPFYNPPKDSQENCYNNLSKGWARSRMWAQYADNHKGVCLIFDKESLVKSFENAFDLCETYCKEVTYTNNLYPLQESLEQNCKSLLTSEKIDFLFQKCQDFRDEQEFRLLLINKDLKETNELVSFSITDSLCGIIPGVNFPKENELSLKKAVEYCNPRIKWLPIRWNYGMPHLADAERLMSMIKESFGEQ